VKSKVSKNGLESGARELAEGSDFFETSLVTSAATIHLPLKRR
jgi:hypothetical protein